MRNMRVLSVDPGYERLGVAIIEKTSGKEKLLYSECIRTDAALSFDERLCELGNRVRDLIEEYVPTAFASESLFFAKNQKTAMDVASVRGALLYIAKARGLPVYEYTPLQIKIAMTGYGKSDKQQVTDMVRRLIEIKKSIKLDDEYDAIAVGLTCLASEKF